MQKEEAEKIIKRVVKEIRKRIEGSTYFGMKLDLDNPEHLMLACYYLGTLEGDI
jgi:hypothetical protein